MKKLFLLLALFGVLGASCSKDDDNVNNSQKPNDKPKGTFVSDVEGVYNVDMSGGEVVVTVTTDIEYKVVIPTDAKSWISVAETRADLRIDKIKFIIAPNETFEELRADVNLVANNGYVLQKISFVQQGNTKVFNSDCEESYLIGAVGGKINIKISTNLDYDVVIPNNDKSWISVADTRAAVREETLTLIAAENKITEERSSVVTLYDNDDNILQKINITQSAKSNTIANNEIWYTTTDGKKLFPPTTEPAVFGAFLVSNTYSDGKGVLTFDDDITLIGGSAFSGCTTLATITIPESVTSIGNSAFSGCSNLTSVNIPDSVTSIGDRAFSGCSSLTCVTIPDGVTTIGDYTFDGCSSLTSVNNILDSVTTIGNYAFRNCSSLTSTTIPDSVTSIGYFAFSGCSSLISITIPDSVTTIGERAFYGCTGELFVNCNIPSASSSDSSAFYGSKFTSVTIGDSVTEIGNSAFDGCSSLTSITIPDSVTTIGRFAFYGCSSLTSVTIGDSVTTIGFYAFKGCTGELVVNCNIPSASYSDSGAFYGGQFSSVTIGDGVTTIGDYAFYDCRSLTGVTIPDSVTTIGFYAFSECRSLTGVTIPDSVTTIGDYAFSECRSLTGVTIPDSVTTIGNSAFSDCDSLTSITIPDSVTSIGEGAFWGCSSLMELNGKFATGDGRCLIVDGVLNSFAPSGLTEYTIPNSVTSIGYAAFAHCYRLTSVTIPDSVTTIGYAAFYNCSSLTSITIPDSVTTIGGDAFYNCYSLASVTIGDSVTTIGEESFFGCSSLTSVTIPDGVTSIGSLAFFGCSSLARIYCKAIIPPYLGSVYLFCYYSDSYELYYPYRIYVPMESVQAYESAEGWSYYISSIVGYDF